ncbi:unnamed protein product [Phytophthora lilii]|uniref:Unnamed protein product n=1 Tax=Phytophthora lilii TaxID=2077276 RepID=A0A9W6U888_9STRA|nr:unnamed protein product [Phytophthora lilii]
MHLSVSVVVITIFAFACITLVSAEGNVKTIDNKLITKLAYAKHPGRFLKGASQSVVGATESLPAEEEERRGFQEFAEKVDTAGAVGGLKSKWQGVLAKIKAGEIKPDEEPPSKLDIVIENLETGEKPKPFDSTNNKWQSLFAKLKASGELRGATKGQVAKLTEEVAEEVVKKPSKWRYLKRALKITLGVGLFVLIAYGLYGMIGSS